MNRMQFGTSLVAVGVAGCSGGGSSVQIPIVRPSAIVGGTLPLTYNGQSGSVQGTLSAFRGGLGDGTVFTGTLIGGMMSYTATLSSGEVVTGSITKNSDLSATWRDSVHTVPLSAAQLNADSAARHVQDVYAFYAVAFDVAGLALIGIGIGPAAIACAIIGAAIGIIGLMGGS